MADQVVTREDALVSLGWLDAVTCRAAALALPGFDDLAGVLQQAAQIAFLAAVDAHAPTPDLVPDRTLSGYVRAALVEVLAWSAQALAWYPPVAQLQVLLGTAWSLLDTRSPAKPAPHTVLSDRSGTLTGMDTRPIKDLVPNPVVSARLDRALVDRLDVLVVRTGRSRGFYLRTAILVEMTVWFGPTVTV